MTHYNLTSHITTGILGLILLSSIACAKADGPDIDSIADSWDMYNTSVNDTVSKDFVINNSNSLIGMVNTTVTKDFVVNNSVSLIEILNTTVSKDFLVNNSVFPIEMVNTSEGSAVDNDTSHLFDNESDIFESTAASGKASTDETPAGHDTLEIVTCKGRCGQIKQWPCSCDARCFVHRNCCENMTSDCSEILDEARSRFGGLLHSDVVCSTYNYFMISSCPHNDGSPVGEMSTKRTSATPQYPSSTSVRNCETSSNTNLTLNIDVNDCQTQMPESPPTQNTTQNLIQFLIMNAPVLDLSTGFVFVNTDIFRCHGGADSHSLLWNALVKARPTGGNPSDMEALEELFLREETTYLPPSISDDSFAMAPCAHLAVDDCSNERTDADPELSGLCRSFFSYVRLKAEPLTYYKNRFCFECSLDHLLELKAVNVNNQPGKRSPLFSATFSLSLSNQVSIVTNEVSESNAFAWKEATCNIYPASDTSEDNTEKSEEEILDSQFCSVGSCGSDFQLRPDGLCKTPHAISMAFADDGYLFTLSEINHLPRVAACFLENNFGIDITDSDTPVKYVFDTRLNKTLYLFKLGAALPQKRNRVYNEEYLQLSALAKTLKRQRKERSRLACQDSGYCHDVAKPRRDNTANSEDDINDPQVIQSVDLMSSIIFQNYITARGQPLENATTTVCCQILSATVSFSVPLKCWEDNLYQMDAVMMETFAESHCMTLFQGDADNGVTLGIFKRYMLMKMFVAILLLQLSL